MNKMIDIIFSHILWTTLIALDLLLSIRLASMYTKDHDKRKLMLTIGLLFTLCTYCIPLFGIDYNDFSRRVFEWCPIPILYAIFTSVLNDRYEIDLNKYYNGFLFTVSLTLFLFFIPLPFRSTYVLLIGLAITICLAIYQYATNFNLASVTLILSMPSYGICFVAILINLTELAIFSGFAAKAFLILACEIARRQKGKVSSPLNLQKELDAANENFFTLFNLLPDPALIVDHKGNILEVTDSVLEVTGIAREKFLTTNFIHMDFLSSRTKAKFVKNLAKRMIGLPVAPYEIEIKGKDHRKMFFEVNAQKIVYKDKAADLVIFRDLTERKRLIQSLISKEERFRDIAENSGDWVWEVDDEGTYVYTNSVVTSILGYQPQEIIGKKFEDFLVKNDDIVTGNLFENGSNSSKSYEFIKCYRHKSGKITILETRGVNIKDEFGRIVGYRGIDRDITEKLLMQQKLLKTERLAAVGQLATMVAHDLRNPLQSIATAADCLENIVGDEKDERISRLTSSIVDSIFYSDKIVNDLLE